MGSTTRRDKQPQHSLCVDEDVGYDESHAAADADKKHGVDARQQQLAQARYDGTEAERWESGWVILPLIP